MADTGSLKDPAVGPSSSSSSPKKQSTSSGAYSFLSAFKRSTGFTKTFSLVYFLLSAGLFSLFCAYRINFLDYEGSWRPRAAPGEWFWFKDGLQRLGMQAHLWSVIRMFALPANICSTM
jgi:hypothetical protein